MVKAKLFTKMEIFIEEIFLMGSEEVTVSMNLTLISSMKENGKKIFFMEEANYFVKNSCFLMDSFKTG